MSKLPILYIPVRPHVRQYLLMEFGADPHLVHQNTYIGKQVLMVAEKLPYRLVRPTRQAPPVTGRFGIIMPKALKHFTITDEGLKEMGDSLEKYFQDQLIMFIKGQVAVTQNERAALRCFFDLYNINPDDYDLEAGRKQFRDYKDKMLRDNTRWMEMQQQPMALAF